MKIIDAYWEKRNMNVDCREVTIENNDSTQDFENLKQDFETEYTVVKIPVENHKFSSYLQQNGYIYMETMISCHWDVNEKLADLNSIQQRFIKEMSYSPMNYEDIELLNSEIEKGIFTTDRVVIDPYFSKKQAANRYKQWIKQETENGGKLFNVNYRGKTVGFFAIRAVNNGTCFCYIAGLYSDYLTSALGFATHYFVRKEMHSLGVKKLLMSFSTNNRGSFALHMAFGYVVDEVKSVFVKHCR